MSDSDSDDTSIHRSDRSSDSDDDDDDINRGYIRPFGISNIGNTCFMNSALQCFLSLPIFVQGIRNLISKADSPKLLKEFLCFIKNHKPNKIKQLVAKKNKAFVGFSQQDSFEFVMTFINAIVDENPKGVAQFFIGKSKTISLCTKCHEETKITEDFSSIALSIQEARRILYVPYSVKKHPVWMSDIPVTSKKIKVRESRTSRTTIGKFILVAKISKEFKIIDKISPEYTDIYAFEIPAGSIDRGSSYIVVQFKSEEGEPITFPFLCQIPVRSISKDRIKTIIIDRLDQINNISEKDIPDTKRKMTITKPEFPPKFKLNDTKISKVPLCLNYINIRLSEDDIFDFDYRIAQNEDKEIDLNTLFNSHIQQKQLQPPCKWTCDKCGDETRAYRRVKYTKLPKILIFQIKRSNETYMTMGVPDNTKVSFPPTISIKLDGKPKNYDEIIINSKDKSIPKYELRSISHHSGSFQGGHYWANGKRNEKWYDFNDKHYEPIDEPNESTESSYVAFYQQVAGYKETKIEDAEETESETEIEEVEEDKVEDDADIEYDEDPGYIGPFGIKSIGNTSFMNSALQCFLSLSLFIENLDNLIKTNSRQLYSSFCAFMINHKPDKVTKLVAEKNKALLRSSQQDSFDFTMAFINTIVGENPKSVSQFFIGKSKTISLCTKCHKETKETEDFSSITLSIQEARRILYVPYSVKKHPVWMSDIPVTSTKIKVRESRASKNTVGEFILVAKISNEFKIIDKISPEYADIYAFEIPKESIDKKFSYIVVQFKSEEGEPITFPFIIKIPFKQISKDRIKTIIIDRLDEIKNNPEEDARDIKSKMNITKPKFPPEFKLNNTKISKTPLCLNYINIQLLDENIFNFDYRYAQSEDKEIDLNTLFNSHIQQKKLQQPSKWTCDKCGEKTCAYRRVKYMKLPKILIFQIKRPNNSSMTMGALDNTKVTFPPTISIKLDGKPTNYDEIISNSKDKSLPKYELRSIIHHTGFYQGGRYWANGKRGDKWYEFDEVGYKQLKLLDVPKDSKGTSYVVFYQQITDSKTIKADDEEDEDEDEIESD